MSNKDKKSDKKFSESRGRTRSTSQGYEKSRSGSPEPEGFNEFTRIDDSIEFDVKKEPSNKESQAESTTSVEGEVTGDIGNLIGDMKGNVSHEPDESKNSEGSSSILPFDQSLQEVLGKAVQFSETFQSETGGETRISTRALLFALSQYELTRKLLERAVAIGSKLELTQFDQMNSKIKGTPIPVDSLKLQTIATSISFRTLNKLARKTAIEEKRNTQTALDFLWAIPQTQHKSDLIKLGVNPNKLIELIHEEKKEPGNTSNAPRTFADKATPKDSLDRADYVNALAGLIRLSKTDTPLTIGIYGPWGQGKSSFMEQLPIAIEKIEGREGEVVPCIPVHFNAWEFKEKDKLWAGLMAAVYEKIDFWSRFENGVYRRWKNFLVFAFYSIVLIIPLYLGWVLLNEAVPQKELKTGLAVLITLPGLQLVYKFFGAVVKPLSQELRKFLQRDEKEQKGFRQEVRQDFSSLLDVLLGKDRGSKEKKSCSKRLVIFIDDLDRCTPDSVVEILEALRIFLNETGVVTILGLDEKFVSLAIAEQYAHIVSENDDYATRLGFGRSYLEKIVQIPVYIQDPTAEQLMPYVQEMVQSVTNKASANSGEENPGGEGSQGSGSDEDDDYADDPKTEPKIVKQYSLESLEFDSEIEGILNDFLIWLPKNPRRIKRLLNIYRLIHFLFHAKGLNFQGRPTMAWLLLRESRNENRNLYWLEQDILKASKEEQNNTLLNKHFREFVESGALDNKLSAKEMRELFEPNSLWTQMEHVNVGALAQIIPRVAWFCIPTDHREEDWNGNEPEKN